MSEQSCCANKLAYKRGPPEAGTWLPHSPAKCLPCVYLLPTARTYYLGVGTPALAQWERGLSASPVNVHEKFDMVTQIHYPCKRQRQEDCPEAQKPARPEYRAAQKQASLSQQDKERGRELTTQLALWSLQDTMAFAPHPHCYQSTNIPKSIQNS